MPSISPELDTRFREAALEQGLLDIAYDIADTPVGPLLVASTDRGLARISFDPDPDAAEDQLARVFGARLLRVPRAVDPVRRQLDEYFGGERHDFELPVDLRVASDFSRDVLTELTHVPYGQVTTYGALATQAGRPRAARAVGTIMNRNPIPIVIPCHRVVGSTGSLVGYGGGLERKQHLLALEGAVL
jgi:methylated-DNA-[protein]-cysteine S-methyltransferase